MARGRGCPGWKPAVRPPRPRVSGTRCSLVPKGPQQTNVRATAWARYPSWTESPEMARKTAPPPPTYRLFALCSARPSCLALSGLAPFVTSRTQPRRERGDRRCALRWTDLWLPLSGRNPKANAWCRRKTVNCFSPIFPTALSVHATPQNHLSPQLKSAKADVDPDGRGRWAAACVKVICTFGGMAGALGGAESIGMGRSGPPYAASGLRVAVGRRLCQGDLYVRRNGGRIGRRGIERDGPLWTTLRGERIADSGGPTLASR